MILGWLSGRAADWKSNLRVFKQMTDIKTYSFCAFSFWTCLSRQMLTWKAFHPDEKGTAFTFVLQLCCLDMFSSQCCFLLWSPTQVLALHQPQCGWTECSKLRMRFLAHCQWRNQWSWCTSIPTSRFWTWCFWWYQRLASGIGSGNSTVDHACQIGRIIGSVSGLQFCLVCWWSEKHLKSNHD